MSPKIDWSEITESNALIHKEGIVSISFLDNGNFEMESIIDKNTNKPKDVKKYFWSVLDKSDKIEKVYSTLSNKLMNLLKEFKPLKDKSFRINKFKTGTRDYDVDFKVELTE